jgi:hypothetical protein
VVGWKWTIQPPQEMIRATWKSVPYLEQVRLRAGGSSDVRSRTVAPTRESYHGAASHRFPVVLASWGHYREGGYGRREG